MVKWQVDAIVQDVTGTNIQKTIFRKRDFDVKLYQEFMVSGDKKRTVKSSEKDNAEDADNILSDSDQESERLYPVFKQSNSMNNMLPSVKQAHDEAATLAANSQLATTDPEEPNKKRLKIEGIKKII